MDKADDLTVHCYSGDSYAERPQSFVWRGEQHVIAGIERRGRVLYADSGVVEPAFSVVTTSGGRFTLSHSAQSDRWTIEEKP